MSVTPLVILSEDIADSIRCPLARSRTGEANARRIGEARDRRISELARRLPESLSAQILGPARSDPALAEPKTTRITILPEIKESTRSSTFKLNKGIINE